MSPVLFYMQKNKTFNNICLVHLQELETFTEAGIAGIIKLSIK